MISQYYYPEPFSIQFLAENLAERGHDITVVTGVPNYPEGAFYPSYSNRKRRSETYQGVSTGYCCGATVETPVGLLGSGFVA